MTVDVEQHGVFDQVEYIPPDAIFDLTKKFIADPSPVKVNLGQGTYKDEHGQPWILPSVKGAKETIAGANHEYLPILGLPQFRTRATELVLGKASSAISQQRVASSQALSGTGALHLAGALLYKALGPDVPVYITTPTWSNHRQVFASIGFQVREYQYYDPQTGRLDLESTLDALRSAQAGAIFIFHASAHNPSGCDPTEDQWRQMAQIVRDRRLFPLFDAAYLGITSGDYDRDAFAIRHFINDCGLEAAVCASFAKNMGLYGERIGLVNLVARSPESARAVESNLEQLMRGEISNPPAYGARILAAVLGDERLRRIWREDLVTMSSRIARMRRELYEGLVARGTPGDWTRIVEQKGMFCILGLSLEQVLHLRSQHHIYMADNSRVSIAGLNPGNIAHTVDAIDKTVQGERWAAPVLAWVNWK